MCYHVEFGRCASKGVGMNGVNSKKIVSAGPGAILLGRGVANP